MAKQRYRFNSKAARDAGIPGASRPRQCLMCTSRFDSTWSGDRICRSCKAKSIWRAGVRAPSRPSGMSG